MYTSPIITFGAGLAKDIGFTRDNFDSGIIWNLLPDCLFFASLYPKNHDAVQLLLTQLEKLGLTGVFNCPNKITEFVLQKNFYRKKVQPTGCEHWIK